ncbi:thioredoxin domain-containing protein [Sulfurovum sp. zt1-1]|uniref:Thioredoxin domain-containing protein n=1 Tax=Sulfurovum zhangzhouensis TaxID=3019067 RepID=A0ABT7R0G4_9BACT|nr:thioredoxin domain-containing protein [Sulfurovum zhangzhouensis]MDM5272591.1 thioredoxin domain-containing protein [Sulfurovum zhangzhouensis]
MQTLNIVCPHCNAVNNVQVEVNRKEVLCSSCSDLLNDTSPLECNEESFKIHLEKNDIPVLVDFYSPDCAPCMKMQPDFEAAAKSCELEVRFLKVNTLDYPDLARQYGVNSLPTVIAFNKSIEMNRFSNALSKDQLSMWAESLIQVAL